MDDHFSAIFDAPPASASGAAAAKAAAAREAAAREPFIRAASFEGAKSGYVFQKGPRGMGYYVDEVAEGGGGGKGEGRLGLKRPRSSAGAEEDAGGDDKRRSRTDGAGADEGEEEGEGEGENGHGGAVNVEDMSLEDLDEETIRRMLDKADEDEGVVELDLAGLKQRQLRLERAINKNQKLRVKHPSQPHKFVDSEVDLDEALKEMAAVAAAPELYAQLVAAGTVTSVLGLLTHDNTDISIGAVQLLQELTAPDSLLTDKAGDEPLQLVDALVEEQGLDLLVQNLSRMNEANDEDVQGVNSTMAVFENLLEVRPTLAPLLCDTTQLLQYLLARLKTKQFDENKLYCSEILSILVNSDTSVQRSLGAVRCKGADGVDFLLQIASFYRRRDPGSPEEEELVENIFDALAGTLLVKSNQDKFREAEGFELMVRCLREKKYAAWCAVKVLDFACTDNPANCERLIECSGLKAAMPVFMGRLARKLKKKKRKKAGDKSTLEEHCISLVTSLALHAEDRPGHECLTRLVGKFVESSCEKLERAMDLFLEYKQKAEQWEARHRAGGGGTGEDSDDEEELALAMLEAGGYSLQRLTVVMVTAAAHSKVAHTRLFELLHQHGLDASIMRQVLLGYIEEVQQGMLDGDGDGEAGVAEGAGGEGGGPEAAGAQAQARAHALVAKLQSLLPAPVTGASAPVPEASQGGGAQ